MNKGILYAIVAGVLGLFLVIFGFFKTLLIALLVVLGFLIGTYLEAKKE